MKKFFIKHNKTGRYLSNITISYTVNTPTETTQDFSLSDNSIDDLPHLIRLIKDCNGAIELSKTLKTKLKKPTYYLRLMKGMDIIQEFKISNAMAHKEDTITKFEQIHHNIKTFYENCKTFHANLKSIQHSSLPTSFRIENNGWDFSTACEIKFFKRILAKIKDIACNTSIVEEELTSFHFKKFQSATNKSSEYQKVKFIEKSGGKGMCSYCGLYIDESTPFVILGNYKLCPYCISNFHKRSKSLINDFDNMEKEYTSAYTIEALCKN